MNLQCGGRFRCTARWFVYAYYIFSFIIGHYKILNTSSLCCIVSPCLSTDSRSLCVPPKMVWSDLYPRLAAHCSEGPGLLGLAGCWISRATCGSQRLGVTSRCGCVPVKLYSKARWPGEVGLAWTESSDWICGGVITVVYYSRRLGAPPFEWRVASSSVTESITFFTWSMKKAQSLGLSFLLCGDGGGVSVQIRFEALKKTQVGSSHRGSVVNESD